MPVTRNFIDAITKQQQRASQQMRSQQRGRTVLGGTSGSAGGTGGPPGGLVGQLVQSKVCYDSTEAETLAGAASLVDNLNHIRKRVKTIENLGGCGLHGPAHVGGGGDELESTLHPGALVTGSIAEDGIAYDAEGRIASLTELIEGANYHRLTLNYTGATLGSVVEEYPIGSIIATWTYKYNVTGRITGAVKS